MLTESLQLEYEYRTVSHDTSCIKTWDGGPSLDLHEEAAFPGNFQGRMLLPQILVQDSRSPLHTSWVGEIGQLLSARPPTTPTQSPLSLVFTVHQLQLQLPWINHAPCAMTSTQTRRSFGGTALSIRPQSPSSSSTASLPIETPTSSDRSTSRSSSFEMPPRANGAQALDDMTDDMAKTELNGSKKSRRPAMSNKRKQSSPMMPAFMVSAPGKVIVFGEHAVVHGKVLQCAILLPKYC